MLWDRGAAVIVEGVGADGAFRRLCAKAFVGWEQIKSERTRYQDLMSRNRVVQLFRKHFTPTPVLC